MTMIECSSVVAAVAQHAKDDPARLCMADPKKSLSYGEAWAAINGLAAHLHTLAPAGSYAVMECNQRCEFIVAMLAMQLAGIIAVPVERNAADSRVAEICQETGAVLFLGAKPRECVSQLPYFDLGSATEFAAAQDAGLELPDADAVAEILFSTGTTGKSKGIVITHRNNVAIAQNIYCGCEAKPGNVEIIPVPLSHSHGLRTVYSNLAHGNAFVCCDGVLAVKVMFNLIEQYHVTAMDLVPSMLSIIFKLTKDRLGEYAEQLDYVELGSAPLAEEDKEHLAAVLPTTRLYNFYGSTESGRSCVLDFAAMKDKPSCIGRPAVNATFIVVDEDRNPIESSADNMGLLASSGPMVMKCYFNAPELTAATMQDGFVYTKDLGYIGQDGLIYMLGRADDVINFGGIKISPEEIEHEVAKSPIVKDCALIAKKDPISGQVPKLYIALEDGAQYVAKEFKAFLASALDANKQPQSIEVIDEIPRTYNGKIKRKELASRD